VTRADVKLAVEMVDRATLVSAGGCEHRDSGRRAPKREKTPERRLDQCRAARSCQRASRGSRDGPAGDGAVNDGERGTFHGSRWRGRVPTIVAPTTAPGQERTHCDERRRLTGVSAELPPRRFGNLWGG